MPAKDRLPPYAFGSTSFFFFINITMQQEVLNEKLCIFLKFSSKGHFTVKGNVVGSKVFFVKDYTGADKPKNINYRGTIKGMY